MNVESSWVCVRPDLIVEPIQRGVQTIYVVKDPLRLTYFELDEHEFLLLQRLTPECDHHQLLEWFNRRFPPLHLTPVALRQMIWQLYQQGLVVPTRSGQGARQAEKEVQERRRNFWERCRSPWAIRLPGINPQPWLPVANCLLGWVYSPWFALAAMPVLVLLAVFALASHQDIAAMSPQLDEFFSQGNLWCLAVAVIGVKVCHELGHAIAAYRRGCHCHELGVLLLAGMPTLYCDVSDAWTLSRRWPRICVSLAGIWMELLIAGCAFIIWSTSVPGLVHAMSFNLMVVCSLGTLLFNANPLVRSDGYYVLMDLTGVSNLGQRSRQLCLRHFDRLLFGTRFTPPLDQPALPVWAVWYGLLSVGYGVVVTGAILWGLHLALKPYAATVILWTIAMMGLAVWGFSMLRSTIHRTRGAVRSGIPNWRVAAGFLAVALGLFLVTLAPWPRLVISEVVLEPIQRQPIITTIAGFSVSQTAEGAMVEAGQHVVQLQNDELQQKLRQLEHEFQAQQQRVQSLTARRHQDRQAAEQLPEAQAALSAVEHRLAYQRQEIQRLGIQATAEGRYYTAPIRPEPTDRDELPSWTGSLLDEENELAWMDAGDEIASIGDTSQFAAIAILPQEEMDAVSVGQPADVLLRSSGRSIRGEVVRISRTRFEPTQDGINHQSAMPTSATTAPQSVSTWYQVEIRCLESCPDGMLIRSRGKVRIHVGSRTIGGWMVHQFFRTFRWLA